ncbi:MAG: hypothetical protein QOF07_162 [Bradyrhizobium sp.]|jgi:hypothetical protein|nr:hypothetical protein [Bradyrhizobium sp.]
MLSSPELSQYHERAREISELVNSLKEVRHDIVHGIAERQTPDGLRNFVRLDYRGKNLIQKRQAYGVEDIIQKVSEITLLSGRIATLVTEAFGDEIKKARR